VKLRGQNPQIKRSKKPFGAGGNLAPEVGPISGSQHPEKPWLGHGGLGRKMAKIVSTQRKKVRGKEPNNGKEKTHG